VALTLFILINILKFRKMNRLILFSVTCFFASISFSQSLLLYDGETVSPLWEAISIDGEVVTNNVANPDNTGINTSAKCISVERNYTNGFWAGGKLTNLSLEPLDYNVFSVMVYKTVPGNVRLQLMGTGTPNYWESIDIMHNGSGWQKLLFDAKYCNLCYISTLLVFIHSEDTVENPDFGTQTMYIDNVEADYQDPGITYPKLIYDGETISPVWDTVAGEEVTNDAENPEFEGINTSETTVKVVRHANNDWWQGIKTSVIFKPTDYNKVSLMVYKTVGGNVKIQLMGTKVDEAGIPDYWLSNDIMHNGEGWQILNFDISFCPLPLVNTLLIFVHTDDATDNPSFPLGIYVDNVKLDYFTPTIPQKETVLYDGETVIVEWVTIGGEEVTNGVPNPDKSGINTSATCVKTIRAADNSFWQGAQIIGLSLPDQFIYDRYSVMVYKTVSGNVRLQLIGRGCDFWWESADVMHNGSGWQEIVFNTQPCPLTRITRVLIFVHSDDATNNSSFPATCYVDNLKVYNSNPPSEVKNVKINTFTVYPNPANDIVYFNGTDVKEVIITDLMGRTIRKISVNENSIDVSGLKQGIYLIIIGEKTSKLVKK